MHGAGNDFVMVSLADQDLAGVDLSRLAECLCHRHFSIGADGLILASLEQGELQMVMYNPDGSIGSVCGNGLRCFAKFAVAEGLANGPSFKVKTGGGDTTCTLHDDGSVSVDMGVAKFESGDIPAALNQEFSAGGVTLRGSTISMGNPHLVLQVDDPSAIDILSLGPAFEHHEDFPDRVNVHFVRVLNSTSVVQRTWERGAGATQACGSGACAVFAALNRRGLIDEKAEIELPGGTLLVELTDKGQIIMTGNAETVAEGELVV
jgi:diaminopimelate epimerase